jgi:hypothetical protein
MNIMNGLKTRHQIQSEIEQILAGGAPMEKAEALKAYEASLSLAEYEIAHPYIDKRVKEEADRVKSQG